MTGKISKRSGWVYVGLALITFALYARVVRYGFLNYDDQEYVVHNSAIQSGLNADSLIWAFTSGYASNWHPLTWISHLIDWQLFGLNHPGGHHFTNVVFHVANTLLLFLLLRQMTGAFWRSAIVAALFAWHPLHIQSVAWVSERKDVLSTFFWLLNLLAYIHYTEESQKPGGKKKLYYWLALLWFALGLMAKPMLVTLPFTLLLLDYWPLRRTTMHPSRPNPWRRLVVEKIPFFFLTIISSVVTFEIQNTAGATMGIDTLSVSQRIFNSMVAYVAYLGKMFWPARLAIIYPIAWITGPTAWCAFLLLLLISVAVIGGARFHRWLLFGWLWYLGTLIPVIGLVQVGAQSMADRYSYVPLVGIFIMLVWGADFILSRWEALRFGPAIAFIILAGCWLAAWNEIGHWRSSEALFRHAIAVTKNNTIAHINLGDALDREKRPQEAKQEFLAALAISPESPLSLNGMGIHLAHSGDATNAIGYYRSAIRNQPLLADAHYNLGNVLAGEGNFTEAACEYEKALEIKPDASDACNNLGVVLVQLGKYSEAVTQFQRALRLRRNYPEAEFQLGGAYQKLHQPEQAQLHYAEAVRLKPDFAAAHFKLGFSQAQSGDLEMAVHHFHEALKFEPQNRITWFNLGAAEEALKHTNEAREAFAEVLRLKPGDKDAKGRLDALGSGSK